MKRAIVLLSGGLDSTTILGLALKEFDSVTALSFSYGQKHTLELTKAKEIAAYFNIQEHIVINLDPKPFEGSSLTSNISVPVHQNIDTEVIPSTYVPARNTIFLSIAMGVAESRKASTIFIGVNSLDYSGYPDCRAEFIEAFQHLANLATKEAVEGNPVKIEAPLLYKTKAEIIKTGIQLGIDYGLTLSCYQPDEKGKSCGICDACILRLAGFKANKMKDPVSYVE